MSAPTVMIGVCTFRRPSLDGTLRSLLAQRLPEGVEARIVVADNDEAPSAAEAVARLAAEAGRPIGYLHAPARNISLARNALLAEAEASGAGLLAFLDDDEWVEPDWLARLLEARAASGADAVFGPVRGVYGDDAADWLRRGAFHDTRPEIDADGSVTNGYTCNTLLDLGSPALRGRRFDPAFGRTGGEDSVFFDGARRDGARLAPAPEAVASEHVPPERARAAWLARRRFRMGQTHGAMIAGDAPALRRAVLAVPALAKAGACLGLAAAQALAPERRNRALLRGCLHLGAASRLLGSRALVLYGGPEPARADPPSPLTDGRSP